MAGLLAAGFLSCGDGFSGNLPPVVILPQGARVKMCTTYAYDFATNTITETGDTQPRDTCGTSTLEGIDAPIIGNFDPDTFDPDGSIVRYRADWGDGSPVEESQSSVFQHLYNSVGFYNLTLTVTDSVGAAGQGAITITVF